MSDPHVCGTLRHGMAAADDRSYRRAVVGAKSPSNDHTDSASGLLNISAHAGTVDNTFKHVYHTSTPYCQNNDHNVNDIVAHAVVHDVDDTVTKSDASRPMRRCNS